MGAESYFHLCTSLNLKRIQNLLSGLLYNKDKKEIRHKELVLMGLFMNPIMGRPIFLHLLLTNDEINFLSQLLQFSYLTNRPCDQCIFRKLKCYISGRMI